MRVRRSVLGPPGTDPAAAAASRKLGPEDESLPTGPSPSARPGPRAPQDRGQGRNATSAAVHPAGRACGCEAERSERTRIRTAARRKAAARTRDATLLRGVFTARRPEARRKRVFVLGASWSRPELSAPPARLTANRFLRVPSPHGRFWNFPSSGAERPAASRSSPGAAPRAAATAAGPRARPAGPEAGTGFPGRPASGNF